MVHSEIAAKRSGYALAAADENPLFYEYWRPASSSPTASATTPLILSDGIGCDGYVWKYVLRDFADARSIIHWQYRGHGRSPSRDRNRLTISDLGADLWSVLDDCEERKAILFGHSLGVQVSLEAYRQSPARVGALVLLCGTAENPLKTFRGTSGLEDVLPFIKQTVAKAPNLFRRIGKTLLPTQFAYAVAKQLEVNGELLLPEDFMPYLHGISRVDPEDYVALLESAGANSAIDLLPSISVPVLIIGGTDDGFTPPDLSKQIADAIPDSEIFLVQDGSHTAPLERPDEINNVIADFLKRRVDSIK